MTRLSATNNKAMEMVIHDAFVKMKAENGS